MKELLFFALGFLLGGVSCWDLIRRYRKSTGSDPNPLAPDKITEYYL